MVCQFKYYNADDTHKCFTINCLVSCTQAYNATYRAKTPIQASLVHVLTQYSKHVDSLVNQTVFRERAKGGGEEVARVHRIRSGSETSTLAPHASKR